ncbi:MAG: M20/M25/M40 family metallo-hydrolase [Sphingomonas sp.]|uniref:M28 family metallopeptidase n=1 Tax=Sphingomonas sp. TaxID=28214 RepID=UPI0025D4034D|nr:M28 family metallopeptidase [Sphingomonas sp.]MBX3565709.1 M20/M25/M40 family metallo-hydrolase [Sphingomonas sp.]
MRLSALFALLPIALSLSTASLAQTAPAGAAPAAIVPTGKIEFNGDRIREDITYLASDKLEGRYTVATGYFQAAAFVADRFAQLGMQPGGDFEKWFQLVPIRLKDGKSERTFRPPNVLGIIPGSDPALKNEYVVISAHLDHLGMGRPGGGDMIFNGAMDNASGVATMLEAARAFTTSGKPPRRSILFVALAAEEQGLVGSNFLARHPLIGDGKFVANVNLDMPILLYDFQDVVAFGAEHSTLGLIVAAAAAKMKVALSPDPVPAENLFVRSDHYSFVKQGIPSIFLVTGFQNGGEKAFKDFLKKHYHQPSDQIDLPFDWRAAARFAKINYLIAREIADADKAPMWYEGNVYGDRYAKNAPRAPKP